MAVKNSKGLFFLKLRYRGFDVADYDLAIRLRKFKMADPIWRLKILKKLRFFLKFEYMGI